MPNLAVLHCGGILNQRTSDHDAAESVITMPRNTQKDGGLSAAETAREAETSGRFASSFERAAHRGYVWVKGALDSKTVNDWVASLR
jgi:hypothetical protein